MIGAGTAIDIIRLRFAKINRDKLPSVLTEKELENQLIKVLAYRPFSKQKPLLKEVTNTDFQFRPSKRTKTLRLSKPCDWVSILNKRADLGRLMVEDVQQLHTSECDILVIVPASTKLFKSLPKSFFCKNYSTIIIPVLAD
jgi:hypothetical protein